MTDQSGNLKRGKLTANGQELIPQAHGGALVAGGAASYKIANERVRREQEELRRKVREEEGAALEEIHFALTSLTRKILKAAERKGDVPPRTTMDVVKEFRQTQEAVNDARQARGAVAEAEEFFASLDSRVAEATARMEHGPQPAVVVSA